MEIIKRTKIEIAKSPEGLEGPGFFATKLEDVVGLARKNSLWPLPFAFWIRAIKFLASPSRYVNGDGNHRKKNGTNITSGI